ncbi:LOB domain-containing protein 40-like [Curcuma longa]|uniref:LOB domain-containing protein 40-like n=1 Tax=Curcuma longa TaxID=136217 RepID=UPI003D9F05A8
MSCNGCRVLRKGCGEGCTIRPCLQWIRSPEAQGNATVFLTKFYGRVGLINLINEGPEHHRPAIFRSLLYEACGRIVNPVYGSVGLLWSSSWQLCQAAVEAVLKGEPITQFQILAESPAPVELKDCDIRHVVQIPGGAPADLHGLSSKSRNRFKRPGCAPGATTSRRPQSQESKILAIPSTVTAERSHVNQELPEDDEGGLELTLGRGEAGTKRWSRVQAAR